MAVEFIPPYDDPHRRNSKLPGVTDEDGVTAFWGGTKPTHWYGGAMPSPAAQRALFEHLLTNNNWRSRAEWSLKLLADEAR